MLDAGEIAPDFTLPNQSRQDVTLSTYRGARTVVLAFHPFAFTPVCSAQMKDYQQAWPALQSLDAGSSPSASTPVRQKRPGVNRSAACRFSC
jgi:peroxiredoxin